MRVRAEHIEEMLAASTFAVTTMGDTTTVLTATLPSGFEITETSACIDPAMYDQDLGESLARQKIASRVWELEGYLLQVMNYVSGTGMTPENIANAIAE